MNQLSVAFKKIRADKFVLISYILLLLWLFVYLLRAVFQSSQGQDIIYTDVTMHLLEYGRYIFIYFLFAVYHFMCKDKEEKESGKNKLAAVFLMIAFEMIVHVIIAVLTFCHLHEIYLEYFMRIVYSVLIYITLPALIAACVAVIASNIRNIWGATVFMVFSFVLFTFDIVGNIISLIPDFAQTYAGRWLGRLLYIFKSYNGVTEYTDTYNPFIWGEGQFFKILGILVLLISICTIFYMKKSKKYVLAGVIISGALIYLSYIPENEYVVITGYRAGESFDSWNIDMDHYKNVVQDESEWETFDIISYDITINAGRTTGFTVSMNFGSSDINDYVFTLYHGYEIKRVTDLDGNQLEYTVSGDYITVHADSGRLDGMIMKYEGVSYVYMADGSHINYPEYYKYYPAAGKQAVFDTERANFVRKLPEEQALFHVKVNASYDVYSNLECVADNEFEGMASGVVLLGGVCTGKLEYNGINIIYPKLEYTKQDITAAYEKIVNFYNKHDISLEQKDWFVFPFKAGNLGNYYCEQEYMAGSFRELYYDMPIDYGFQNWGE